MNRPAHDPPRPARGAHMVAAWADALHATWTRSGASADLFRDPAFDPLMAAIAGRLAGPDAFAMAGLPTPSLADVILASPPDPTEEHGPVPVGARSRAVIRALIGAGHAPIGRGHEEDVMDAATKRCRDLVPDLLAAGYVPSGTHGALQIARLIRDGRDATGLADAWIASGTMPDRDAAWAVIRRVTDLTATSDARTDAALAAVLDRPGMPPPSSAAVAGLLRFVGDTADLRGADAAASAQARGEDHRPEWIGFRRSDAAAVAVRRGGMPDRTTMDAVRGHDDVRAALRAAAHEPVAAMAGHLLFPGDLPHPGLPDPASVRWAMEQAAAHPDDPWTMALLAWAGTTP